MAFETELANIANITDTISAAITEAFVQGVVVTPLIRLEPVPQEINVKKWRKDGNLVAEALAESAPYTFSANSELVQSTVTSTATKFAVVSKLTVEALRFAPITLQDIVSHQAQALMRDLDDEIKALFSGFTADVTAATTLDKDSLLDASFTVRDATAGVSTDLLRVVIDRKGHNEVRKEISDLAGAVFGNSAGANALIDLLINRPEGSRSGRAGIFADMEVYTASGLPLDTGDDVGLCFDSMMAIAGMIDQIRTEVVWKGSEGMYWEIASYLFADFVEYNDEAGCRLRSDT